ncbi:MAG: hypothetical protein IJI61_03235 [Oscillospiraceae bacterium]|nr:hypothetical protein [Oscillospiraceae bacterium]
MDLYPPVGGCMPIPEDFPYKDVILRGMPQHEHWDSFLLRHPPMPAARWAKIYTPFDALKGFDGAIASKKVHYVPKTEPDEEFRRELDRKLHILRDLTRNGRMAGDSRVSVTVRHFVLCADENSPACGMLGLYEEAAGTVLKVDTAIEQAVTLQTDSCRLTIAFDDIIGMESNTGIFETGWE